MNAFLLQILEQSFIFLPLALGLYLSFYILRLNDITADGSFVLGAAVFAKLTTHGYHPWPSLLIATAASALIGAINSLMQSRGRMPALIASIFLLFILGSFTLILMGQPSINLLNVPTIFSALAMLFPQILTPTLQTITLACLAFTILVLLSLLLRSRLGLLFQAYGGNPLLLLTFGRNPATYRTLGLMISSSLAGLSGAFTAQISGYAELTMGAGQALIGIALVLLGLQIPKFFSNPIFPNHKIEFLGIFSAIVFYFFIVGTLIRCGLNPLYLRFVLSIFFSIFFLFAPSQFTLFSRKKS